MTDNNVAKNSTQGNTIQGLIQNVKNTNLQEAAGKLKDVVVQSLPTTKENKEALGKLGTIGVEKFIPNSTIGQLKGPGGINPMSQPDKLETFPLAGKVPTFKGISTWDKFKNSLGKMGSGLGLQTHEITNADYVWKPKLDKDGKPIINKQGFQEGSYVFDWKAARESDKLRGRTTQTEFDPTKLINMGLKAATKGAL